MRRSITFVLFLSIFSLINTNSLLSCGSVQSAGYQQDTLPNQNATKQPVYTTTRLSTAKPVIDGKLGDECWETGVWAGDYHQYTPNEGANRLIPPSSQYCTMIEIFISISVLLTVSLKRFRVDLNLTPEFSIQYYGSPFVSRGSFSEFKRITDPEAEASIGDSYQELRSIFPNKIVLIKLNYWFSL